MYVEWYGNFVVFSVVGVFVDYGVVFPGFLIFVC